MQIVKQSVARDIPCLLIDLDGSTPDTGVVAGSVTISSRKEGASAWTAKTATGNWTEVGKGAYLISWSTTDLNTVGRFDFVVEVSGDINYYGSLVVSANLLDDLATDIGALNDLALTDILSDSTAFAGANIAAIVSAIAALENISAADVDAELIIAHGPGSWEGGGAAPTVAAIAEAVHDVKVTFNKTTGGLVITMADDTPLTSVTITDTAGEVTRE